MENNNHNKHYSFALSGIFDYCVAIFSLSRWKYPGRRGNIQGVNVFPEYVNKKRGGRNFGF